MKKPDGQEKRARSRVDLGVTMPIHLTQVLEESEFPGESGSRTISCRLFDVSASGIGILLVKPLEHGQKVRFQTLGKSWQLEVSWCEKSGESYRCGLTLVDKSQDMSVLFSSFSEYRNAV